MTTPEEIFNQQVWEVLQDIKEEILATETGKPVKYRIPSIVGVGIIPPDRRIKILYKLQEMKTFEIQRNARGVRIGSRDTFYLIINPKKFDEVYTKYQKTCDVNSYLDDYQQKAFKGKKLPKFSQVEHEETEIDKWLAKKDKWTLKKIWQVVSALNAEWQLRDEDVFDIPHDKFERARITNSKDLEVVLKSLHKYTVIEVSRKIRETSPSNDPNKPQVSLWDTIIDKLEIADKADTQIRIFPKLFTYLRDTLAKMVSEQPQEKKKQKKKKQYIEKAEWPGNFHWEGKTFVFGEYGKISFKSKDRRFIFKILTNKKGDWATIIETKGEKDAGYVRSTIKQIEDRFPEEVKKHVIIISTQDDDSEKKPNIGAYRIKILP